MATSAKKAATKGGIAPGAAVREAPARQQAKPKKKKGNPTSDPKGELNARQMRFIDEYLIDLNATKAAIRAGYSPKTADVQASALLSKLKVQEEVDRRKEERSKRVCLTADNVLRELGRIVQFDIRKLLGPDGSPKPLQDLDDDTAAAIAGLDIEDLFEDGDGVKQFIGTVKKYKISDKVSAISLAMRHFQLFDDKVTVEVNVLSKDQLDAKFGLKMAQARERTAAMLRDRGIACDD